MRHRNGHSVSRNASRWSELRGTALHRCPRQPPVLRALADRDLSTDEAERTQPPARGTTQPDAASWGTCVGPPARLTGRARAESEHGWRCCSTVTRATPASGVIMTAAARGWAAAPPRSGCAANRTLIEDPRFAAAHPDSEPDAGRRVPGRCWATGR